MFVGSCTCGKPHVRRVEVLALKSSQVHCVVAVVVVAVVVVAVVVVVSLYLVPVPGVCVNSAAPFAAAVQFSLRPQRSTCD